MTLAPTDPAPVRSQRACTVEVVHPAELDLDTLEPLWWCLLEIQEPDETFVTGPIAEVHSLVVAPSERGAGLGGALMDAVDAELDRLGVADVLLDYLAGNDAAARFYERRGFVPFVNALYRRRGAAAAAPPSKPGNSDTEEDA